MKIAQKIEIGLGAATSLTTFIFFCCFAGFFLDRDNVPSDANSFAFFLFLIWLVSLLVAVGTYFNAVKQSKIALFILVIGTIFITVVLGFWSFFILLWGGIFGLFPLIPTVLSALTAITALNSRMKNMIGDEHNFPHP